MIKNYLPAIISITVLFMACNGGQVDTVRGDSTLTNNTLKDTSALDNQHEMATVSSEGLPSDSRQFMNEMTNKLSLNINLSKAAISQSSDEGIKNLGKTVADQQTELQNKLNAIAETKNIRLAADLPASMQEALTTVTSKKDKEFNDTYLDRIIKDSEATISWLESQATNMTDEPLKQFASTAIPIYQQHLDAAKALMLKK